VILLLLFNLSYFRPFVVLTTGSTILLDRDHVGRIILVDLKLNSPAAFEGARAWEDFLHIRLELVHTLRLDIRFHKSQDAHGVIPFRSRNGYATSVWDVYSLCNTLGNME